MGIELINIIFGMKVRQARMEAGLALTELAAAAELSPSYLTEIERGRKYPRANKIVNIAAALGRSYDEMVSIQLEPSLAYLEAALASPLFREFPFEEFGLELGDLVSLMTRAPDQMSALVHALVEVGRRYDMKEEHFFLAILRSYQELHDNYFPELEEAAATFAAAEGLERVPVTREALTTLLVERFGYVLDETRLAQEEALRGYRSLLIDGSRPKLLINPALMERQIKFLLAREIGYRHLGLTERSHVSSPDRVDSFQQVFNDFRASYFAGALLMPRGDILDRIDGFLGQATWQPELLLAMLARYEVTPEMLLYRFSELIPQFFGAQLHFLRYHRQGERYLLIKQLNMNQLRLPSGSGRHEHHCRRWLSVRLLQELGARPEVSPTESLTGVQLSEFLESRERYLCIGMARPLVLQPAVLSSVIVGLRADGELRRIVRFLDDPAIPRATIHETCERCPLTIEQCQDRAAPPMLWEARQARRDRHASLAALRAELRP